MAEDYTSDAQAVAEAIEAVYENKQSNKKNSISGDYSSDNESYPTVKAVKNQFGEKVTSWSNDVGDGNYPSEKLVHDTLINSNSNVKNGHVHGNVSSDGKIGSTSGKIVVTGTGGALDVASTISGSLVTDSNLHSHLGTGVNATQEQINTAVDNMVNINVVKQSTADTGYASTYYITQNGTQVGPKIQIEKDKMVRSISIETVGATPTQEEIDAGMTTGDKYILIIVNTVDNDGTSRLILPITDVFDLQTADESTLTLSSAGVFSIKSSGVDTAQIKDGAVTADKIASAVKNGWWTESDSHTQISAFATALANAINPSS